MSEGRKVSNGSHLMENAGKFKVHSSKFHCFGLVTPLPSKQLGLPTHPHWGREQTALELPKIRRTGVRQSTVMITAASWPFKESLASRVKGLLLLFLELLVK